MVHIIFIKKLVFIKNNMYLFFFVNLYELYTNKRINLQIIIFNVDIIIFVKGLFNKVTKSIS